MPIKDYSTTPSVNSSINSINIGEGCPPSGINDAIRQQMADTRSFAEDREWLNWGDAHAYASATTTTVSGDVTARYAAGRRVRAQGAATGTIYGKIASAVYAAPNTTITYAWDSGALANEALTICLGLDARAVSRDVFLSLGGGNMAGALNEARATTVAAEPLNIGSIGANFIVVSGTSISIANLGAAPQAGAARTLYFLGANTIVHNAGNIWIPSGSNRAVAAGDTVRFRATTTGNWNLESHIKADGTAVVSNIVAVEGGYRNLRITNGASPNTQIAVTVDALMLSTVSGSAQLVTAVSLVLSTLSVGANALDAGAVAASTWYSVWVIYNPTTATTAGLLSTSATAPTMPSGYTHKSRVGWVRTDGTANKYLMRTLQVGKKAWYVVTATTNTSGLPLMASGVAGNHINISWVAVSTASFVPTTAQSILGTSRASTTYTMVAPNNGYGAYNSTSNPPPVSTCDTVGAVLLEQFNIGLESSNIYWVGASAASAIYCRGWEDA